VWRGIVARPPRLNSDGLGWDIALDPIVKALDQRVSASESLQYRIRGIYHSANFPVRLWTEQIPNDGHYPVIAVFVTGFFETVEDFAAAVNAALASIITERTAQIGGDGSEISESVYWETGAVPTGTLALGRYGDTPVIRMKTADYVASTLTTFEFVSLAFSFESYLEGFCTASVGSTQYSGRGTAGLLGDAYHYASLSGGFQQQIDERFGNSEGKFSTPLSTTTNAPIFSYPLSPARSALGSIVGVNATETSSSTTNVRIYKTNPALNTLGSPSYTVTLVSVTGLNVDDYLVCMNVTVPGSDVNVVTIRITAIASGPKTITADIVTADVATIGFIAESVIWPAEQIQSTLDSSLNPPDRIYLDDVTGISEGDTLLVKNGDKLIPVLVTAVDTDDRFVTATISSSDPVVWFDAHTEIVPIRVFATNTDLHGFLENLQDKSENANDGDTPYIPPGDISIDAFALPYTVSDVPDYWRYRNYIWLKPTVVKEVVREELKAIGWMLRLTATGSIGCTKLPLATAGASSTTLDETKGDILYPAKSQVGTWPRWEAQSDGLVNTIQVSLGYRIGDDDFDPKFDFTIRDVTSIAEHKSSGNKGDQSIAPKSTSVFAETLPGISPSPDVSALLNEILTPTTVAQWVSGYLRVLSQDYATVTLSVPFRFFSLLIGDHVNVTCALLPNGLGTRGMTSSKAVVVGRKWSFDPASNSMGTLTLYFPREVASGYAPSAHITAQANVSGDTWDLSCSSSDPAQHPSERRCGRQRGQTLRRAGQGAVGQAQRRAVTDHCSRHRRQQQHEQRARNVRLNVVARVR
jgi:hypothetical protein